MFASSWDSGMGLVVGVRCCDRLYYVPQEGLYFVAGREMVVLDLLRMHV